MSKFYIIGKHSIQQAANNPYRSNQVFYGKYSVYKKLNLNCKFEESYDEYLLTNELIIDYPIGDFLEHNKIILLDGLMNPKNIGSIIRSAAAFGFYVILRKGIGCPLNETVVECASGGADSTKIIELSSIKNQIDKFKKNGFWFIGLHETGDTSLQNYTPQDKIVLVVGSEHDGISKIILDSLDFILKIDTKNSFSTLNASIAASISMFKLS